MLNIGNKFKAKTIADLQVGEVAYIVTWAIFADKDGNVYLDGSYTVDSNPEGTVKIKVGRSYSGYWAELFRSYSDHPIHSREKEIERVKVVPKKSIPVHFDKKPTIWQDLQAAINAQDLDGVKAILK